MFKKITLPNGLRVLFVPQIGAKSVTVLVLVEAGSKYEVKELNGISHFLEHMMFKGTSKRPSPLAIATELDRIGGDSNAFTGHEYTGYYIKADSSHLELALDLISDIFQNSLFQAPEMEKEKGVIIEEINMYYDHPERYVGDLWLSLLYGDQPAGWPISGTKESVRRVNREALLAYVQDHYVTAKTVVVIAGDLEEGDMTRRIKEYFSQISSASGKVKPPTNDAQHAPQVFVHFRKTDQTHVVLGVRAFDAFDPRKYTLDILNTIMGVGMSSRLFQILRVGMGAAYYVRSSADLFTDHGYLAASGGFNHEKLEDVVRATLREFVRFKEEQVPAEELKKAKEQIRGSLTLNTETTDQLAGYVGSQEILTKEILSPEEYLAKIDAVRQEDIHAVARDIFREERLNLALIGPFEEKTRFENLLRLS